MNTNMDEITEARRKAIKASIRSLTAAEVTTLGETLFPYHDDPWRKLFFDFLAENPRASFYHAKTDDHVEILYCHDKGKESGLFQTPVSVPCRQQASKS